MIIADSGFWLALANNCDTYHSAAKRLYDQLDEDLITTWPVMTETCHLLVRKLGMHAELNFIKAWINGAFEIYDIPPELDQRIFKLMTKYADLPMDLADASLVILAEHLGHGRIFSSDRRDFKTYRWKNHKPFENLL